MEDEPKDKRSKLCAEDGESKITEQTSTKNTTADNNNRESSSDTSKENSKASEVYHFFQKKEKEKKASEVQKPDCIHVRAHRGQATDSHSLAERVRKNLWYFLYLGIIAVIQNFSSAVCVIYVMYECVMQVRRERISERMKILQDLVPGCNKMTGKAVILDKIINYVQSLPRQVEVAYLLIFYVILHLF